MADDTHLNENDALNEHNEAVDASDPFATLLDMAPDGQMDDHDDVADSDEIVSETLDTVPVMPARVVNVAPAPIVPADDAPLESFLDAEFAAPSIDPLEDVNALNETELLSQLDANFAEPIAQADPQEVEPLKITDLIDLEDDFDLSDADLDAPEVETALPVEPEALSEEFDLDDLGLDVTEISTAAAVASEPIQENAEPEIDIELDDFELSDDFQTESHDTANAEIDIDDIFAEDKTEIIDNVEVTSVATQPAATPAPAVDVNSDEFDLFSDIDLELDEAVEPLSEAYSASDLKEVQISNALRDAEVEKQIQSLDAHYTPVEPAPVEIEPELTHIDEVGESSDSSVIGGVVAAGTVGLGLSKVFGSSAAIEPEIEPEIAAEDPVNATSELEMTDLESVLGEIEDLDIPKSEVSPEPTIESDPFVEIEDFTAPDPISFDNISDEGDVVTPEPAYVPSINIVDPDVTVPVSGTISVPHIDYDIPVEPVVAGPDDFEQAISDSFAEMQDDDLLANTDLRPSLEEDLDLALGDIDLSDAITSDEAYRSLIADEQVVVPAADEVEFGSSSGNGLDFSDDEMAGLRREAGHHVGGVGVGLPLSEITGIAAANEASKKPKNRKGLLVAACLAGIAIIAAGIGFGSGYLSNDAEDQSAMIIRSDTDDVKEIPTEPSGVEVPNQDRAVFNESATTTTVNNEQSNLVDSSEPLVDENSKLQNSNKDLDRINPEDTVLSDASKAVEDAAQSVMTPRRVQTLVVRPDGTIAPANAAPKVETQAADTPVATDDAERLLPKSIGDVGADIASVPKRVVNTVTVRNNETPRIAPRPSTPSANSQITPDVVPIVPSRPATQPVTIVSNNAPAAPQPTTPARNSTVTAAPLPAGSYFVQIASTPSESDARATGNRLTSRFGAVFGGRGFVIRRAEIEGKGTFYRVRVPGGTKNEAASLCTRYKSAGGSCFISR